jgi:hypothetical protein
MRCISGKRVAKDLIIIRDIKSDFKKTNFGETKANGLNDCLNITQTESLDLQKMFK